MTDDQLKFIEAIVADAFERSKPIVDEYFEIEKVAALYGETAAAPLRDHFWATLDKRIEELARKPSLD